MFAVVFKSHDVKAKMSSNTISGISEPLFRAFRFFFLIYILFEKLTHNLCTDKQHLGIYHYVPETENVYSTKQEYVKYNTNLPKPYVTHFASVVQA